ncbi:MAG: hypothetical protein H6878_11875 [Rhodobiaceae bacterium]|nr:hypothetical protein [Rhodobiaceae bacterium]MCC0016959.1 hypothetical protein [Rhodobiaceae bacterium]MCC0054137.1 hypothetical protein [Rhodobiaceae bacterium]
MSAFVTLLQHVVVVLIGFAAAGVAHSAYNLAIAQPPRFDHRPKGTGAAVLHVLLLLFAGPMVLARNSYRGRVVEGRAMGWIAASGGIAAGWCLLSGVFILTLIDFVQKLVG